MSSRIMQNFLTLGKNFENNKKVYHEDEERQIFLKNLQLSLTHLRSINCPTQKKIIKNKISKVLLSNKKDLNDPYFIYLRNIYEIQRKVQNQLNDDSNIHSPFSNKIYNYFQSENNLKEIDIKIKKSNHQKKKTNKHNKFHSKKFNGLFPKKLINKQLNI